MFMRCVLLSSFAALAGSVGERLRVWLLGRCVWLLGRQSALGTRIMTTLVTLVFTFVAEILYFGRNLGLDWVPGGVRKSFFDTKF